MRSGAFECTAYRSRTRRPTSTSDSIVNAFEPHLRSARIIPTIVACEVDMKAAREWWQAAYALRAVKERRGSGDEQIQSREALRVHFVNELAQRIEALLAHIPADALDGLN